MRTGYSAIADEWIGIRPGTDGLFVAALIHELLTAQQDRCRLPGALHQRALAGDPTRPAPPTTACSRATRTATPLAFTTRPTLSNWPRDRAAIAPALVGDFHARRRPQRGAGVPAARRALPRRRLRARAVAERETGIPAATIRRIAAELAHAAFEEAIDARHPLDRLATARATTR